MRQNTTKNDAVSIFDDDVIEVHLNSEQRNYFQIAVNTNGAIWDESTDSVIVERDTLPALWNPGSKAVVKKFKDRWTLELMIPVDDLGTLPPSKVHPWGIQIGRTRITPDTKAGQEWFALGPGSGPYKAIREWGDLW